MSVVSVRAKDFILALFIRDDGERFLLGDNGYDFKDSQLHFSANTIENDEVQKQGADGVILAGQVRRSSVQSFDGYVGDATMLKETIEEMRKDFIAFFARGHHFRVIYIDTARNAWQRKGGYLVDAPEVKELYQIHPDYHVGLNFEDVNYYSYDEDKDGNEILSNLIDVPVSTDAEGGLVWDEYGAVSEEATVEYDTETATATPAKSIHIADATEAQLASFQLDGETSQNGTPTPDAPVAVQTVTGENVVQICGKNLFNKNKPKSTYYIDGSGNAVDTGNYEYINQEYSVSGGEGMTVSFASKAGAAFVRIAQYRGDGTFIQRSLISTSPTTVTLSSDARKIILSVNQSNALYFTDLQVEYGSATAYEPYKGQSYEVNLGNIELCKIGDYQDYIYKDGTDWKIHKAVGETAIDGTVGVISRNGTNRFNIDNINLGWKKLQDAILCLANSYITVPQYDTNGGFNSGTSGMSYALGLHPNANTIRIKDVNYDNADNYKTWLGNNPIMLYYALATPTDTEITNQALVAQLDALLTTARTYAGINNIFTITPNEQGTLEISYYTKYQPVVSEGGYIWGAGGSGGATTVINNSIGNVNPVWTIYGPTNNPVLENTTTGEQIEYVGSIADGQTLTIDMGEQTASLDGLNVISNVIGDYISLAPGANTLIYSVSGDAGASELGWSEIVG